MTADEMRSAADYLQTSTIGRVREVCEEILSLAASLRAEAEAMERDAGEITPEMVEEWRKKAGGISHNGKAEGTPFVTFRPVALLNFAALAAEHGARREREECAQRIACQIPMISSAPPGSYARGYGQGLRDALAAIRARKP